MPEGQLEVGEAEEESVDIDVDPNAKTIRSDAEPEQPPEVIQEEKKDELEDYSAGVKTLKKKTIT